MKFVVFFEDNPEAAIDVRERYMSQHIAFLRNHSTSIDAAGPLVSEDGSAAGGLWIVDADIPSVVTNLIEEDPFWSTGLRKSVRILRWNQVFTQGTVLLNR